MCITYRIENINKTSLKVHSLRDSAADDSTLAENKEEDVDNRKRTIEDAKHKDLWEVGKEEHEDRNNYAKVIVNDT